MKNENCRMQDIKSIRLCVRSVQHNIQYGYIFLQQGGRRMLLSIHKSPKTSQASLDYCLLHSLRSKTFAQFHEATLTYEKPLVLLIYLFWLALVRSCPISLNSQQMDLLLIFFKFHFITKTRNIRNYPSITMPIYSIPY